MAKTRTEPFLVNPKKTKTTRSKRVSRRQVRKPVFTINPFGEELTVIGLNPYKTKKHRKVAAKASHGFSLSGLFKRHKRRGRPRKSAAGRVKAFFGLNPHRQHHRKHRSGYRHNPAATMGMGVNVQSLLPEIGTGAAGIIASSMLLNYLPIALDAQWKVYGAQAGIGVVGAVALNKFVGKRHAAAWAVGVGAVVLADVLKRYVIGAMLPGVGAPAMAGMGYLVDHSSAGVSAYPNDHRGMSGMEAFPNGNGGHDGMSDYPYGGGYPM